MGSSERREPPWKKMAEERAACGREIQAGKERASLAAASFRRALLSVRSATNRTLADGEILNKANDYLCKLEVDLAAGQSVLACRDAKHKVAVDSLSTVISRINKLKVIVDDQRAMKNEYTEIIRQQLIAQEYLEQKHREETKDREKIDEAVMWYNRVLGFRVKGGEGVQFIFDKIDPKNPSMEFSFTVSLNGDKYSLLHCDPYIEFSDGLVNDLNETNSLFKFVRIMREKFIAVALSGPSPRTVSSPDNLDSSSIAISSPPPASIDSGFEMQARSDTVLQSVELDRSVSQNISARLPRNPVNPSPVPLSDLRRSPRFQARKLP